MCGPLPRGSIIGQPPVPRRHGSACGDHHAPGDDPHCWRSPHLLKFRQHPDKRAKMADISTNPQTNAQDAAARQRMVDEINSTVKADQGALGSHDTFTRYAGGFAKTASLFATGGVATAATLGLYTLDSVNPSDSAGTMALDGALGFGKGLGTRAVFNLVGRSSMGVVGKGLTMGFGSTLVDAATTRQTYTQAGSIWGGLENSLASAADRKNLLINAGMFMAAQGLVRGGSALTAGALERSPLLSTMATGGAFGMTSGGLQEIMRQSQTGKYDPWQVARQMLIQGGLDAGAASIGGLQADAGFRAAASERLGNTYAEMVDRVNGLKACVLNLADSVSLGPRLQPAYALAGMGGGRFFEVEMPARRPSEPQPRGPQVMMMQGDGPALTHSGADLDHVLGAGGHAELVSTADHAAQDLIARVIQESAAEPPAPERAAAAARPVQDARGVVGKAPVALDPAIAASEAFQGFHALADRVMSNGSGEQARADLVGYLRAHPELRDTVINYARSLDSEPLVYAAQEAYKVPSPRVYVATREQANSWYELDNYFRYLEIPSLAARGRQAVAGQLELYPELRPAAEEYARGSSRLSVVEALDSYLGTSHASDLRLLQSAHGGQAAPPPAPVPGVEAHAGAAGESPAPAGTLEMLAAARAAGSAAPGGAADLRAEGTDPRLPGAPGETPGYTPPSAENPRGMISADEFARGLTAEQAATRAMTVRVLANEGDLNALSPENFQLWLSEARSVLPDVFMLMRKPGASSLPPEAVQRFLGKPQSSGEPPEWAADAVRTSEQLQARRDQASLERLQRDLERARDDKERAQIQSRIRRQKQNGQRVAYLAKQMDEFPRRARLLTSAVDAVDKAPELAGAAGAKLIELGSYDPLSLDKVLYSIGYRTREGAFDPTDELGARNRQLLAGVLPNATSIEPVRYLLQFLRDGNADGVFQAAQRLAPAAGGEQWIEQLLRDMDAGLYRPARKFGNNDRGGNPRQAAPGASAERAVQAVPAPEVAPVPAEPAAQAGPAPEMAPVPAEPAAQAVPAPEVAPVPAEPAAQAGPAPEVTSTVAPAPGADGAGSQAPAGEDPLASVTPYRGKVSEQQKQSLSDWFQSLKPSVQRNMFRNNTEIRGQAVKGMYTRQLCKLIGYVPEGV